ncbi:MAG: PKD domain-containing protein, partial [Bacteroidetes bacterium]|nr:PKD domain-containing protein [Bacteroidota bacterium]
TLSLTSNTIASASYNWTGPNSFTSTLEDPVIAAATVAATGTYSVNVTVAGCAGPSATTSVTVNPIPAAPVPGSNTPICAGQTLSLTSNTIASASYNWTGPNSFTSTLEDPVIAAATVAATGTYSVNVTVAGCAGPSATTSVTVNPIPAAPVPGSNTPICAGQTLSLTSNTIASASYNWTGPNSFTSTSEDPVIAAATTAASGTYSVNVTVAGCAGPSATTSVTVNPIPAAPTPGSNTPVCSGNDLSLTASSTGTTYSWSGPNSFTSASQNPTIAGVTTAASGTYSVTATTSGCTSTAATTSVTINQTPVAPVAGNNSPICVGINLSLTASSTGSTYNWNGPNSFTSTSQNPVIAAAGTINSGTYSVTATSAAGCASPVATTSVVVNPPPSAPTAGSNSPVCSGQTLSLTSSTVVGATYFWSGPNSFTAASQNPTIIGVTTAASGTYSLIATVAGCPPLTTQTISVTINQTPTAPTAGSNSPVCLGGNISLTASATGATYNWTGPNSFTSTSQNPVITPAATINAGTYSVTATSAAGCISTVSTTSVVVNPPPPPPAAGSNSPVCSGQTISLTVATIISATYSWTGPNSFTSTVQNPIIGAATTLASGTYSIIATVPGCGPSSTGTVAVTVNETPVAPSAGSNSPVCSGNDISLTASGTGVSYTWTGPGGFTSTTQNPVITPATTSNSGTYSVTTTSAAGCTSVRNTVAVTVNQTPAPPVAGSNSPVCSGQILSLTASSVGTSYSWSGPNGFTSTSQNPTIGGVTTLATGTYSVIATASGCTGPAGTVSVTINQTPVAPAPGSNSPICAGTDLSLTASSTGTSYNWNGPNSFTSTSQNPVITAAGTVAAGTYSVTATENGCTCPAGTVSVTINPAPATPTAGSNSPVCVGNTISLTASTIGGTTYSWSGPNSFTSTSQNPTIPGVTTDNAGTYSVSVTSIATGCVSTVNTTTVIVNPPPSAPTVGSNSPVCSGQTLSLTSSTVAGATYSWTGPNSFTSSSQNPAIGIVTTSATGTYSLIATVGGCPPLPTQTVSVIINQTPAVPVAGGNTPVCVGNDISLTASATGATYNWSGPNSFTSTTQNPVITPAATTNSGTYSVTATSVDGCTSTAGTVAIVVNAPPSTPIAGSNSPFCSGQTLSLTSNTISGATYSWSGPNSFTSTSQNPIIAGATTAASGTYSVVAIVPGCSTSPAGTVSVTVNEIPSAPTAGSNSPICSGQDLSLTANTVGGATYSWNGPNGFTSTSQNPVISPASTTDAGTYTVNLTASGCTSPDATVSITINQTPAIPAAGSNSPICEGQNLSLTATAGGSPTYSWNGPNSFTSTLQNPTIAGATTADAGTYTVNVTENGCTSVDSTVNVIINQTPAAPAAGSNTPVCSGQTLSLTASTIVGVTYSWSGPNGFTSTAQNPTIINVTVAASGTYSVFASIGGCTGPVGITSVTVNPTPNPAVGSNSPVCEGNILSLTSSAVAGATYSWSGPNGFTSTSQNPSIAGVTSSNAGTYTLTVTSSLGCVSNPKTTVVTITPPILVSAGADQTVCANNATVTLNGSVSGGTTTGNWTTSGTGTFVPTSTTLNADYIPSSLDTATGILTFTLTSTGNGGCTAQTAVMTLTITDAPTANAGADQTLCANNDTVILNGSVNAAASGGIWISSGTGTFSPDNLSLSTTYIPDATDTLNGSVTIVLVTTGIGTCLADTDTVIVTITPAPIVNAGISTVACKNNANVPLNGTSSTGSGIWTTLGTGTFVPTPTTLNAIYNSSTPDTISGSVILILTSTGNGGCNPVTDTIVITYIDKPIVNAGADVTVCGNNASVALSGTSNTGSGTWAAIGGGGTFVPNSLNSTFTPSGAQITAGTATLILTSANNGTCNSVKDTLIVTITPAPTVNAGADQTVCANNSVVTLSGSFTTSTGAGWTTLGSGTFSPDTFSMGVTYTPSPADTFAGSVTIILTSTGNGLCNAVTDTMIITITPAPVVNAGPDIILCFSNLVATLNGTSSTGSGTWSTPNGSGTFGNASSLVTTYTATPADTTADSVIIVLTSAGNGLCNPVTDTMIITFDNFPSVNAGSDVTVCANADTVFLNGSSTTGSGVWTTSGTGTFSPDSITLNAFYIPSDSDTIAGTVTLTLTSLNGCAPVADSIIVTITPAPVVNAGPNQTICATQNTVSLNGSVSSGATTGQWTTLGSGTFSPDDLTLNATYSISTTDSAAGNVTLILTSTNNGNCLAVSDTVKLFFLQPPVANAGADQTVCANNAAQLNGTITGGSGTGIWTTPNGSGIFAPGNTSLNGTYTPSINDALTGNIILVLTSTNNGGCTPSTDTVIIYVNPGPIVGAGTDQFVCSGSDSITLNGTVLNSTGGQWTTSGNGTFSPNDSTLNGNYIFGSNDTSTVTLVLTSTGNGQCVAVTDTMILIIGRTPVAAFSGSSACTGQTVTFTDASTIVNDTIVSWDWIIDGGTDTLQNPIHTYTISGTDTVTLIVTTNIGCTDTVVHVININPTPAASFSFTVDCVKDSVFFTDNSSIASGNIISWNWNFGDATTSPLQNPVHSYSTSGTFTVTLTISSDSGCTATAVDTVVSCTNVIAGFVSSDSSVCTGQTIAFTDTSTVMAGDSIISWIWNFGDGGTDTVKNPSYSYSLAGTYTVTLIVGTNAGSSDTAVHIINVNPTPVASFSYITTCLSDSVYFNDLSAISLPGNIISWSWDFGDATTSTLQNPVHSYTTSGTVTVTLTVTSDSGCTSTYIDSLIPGKPVIALFASASSACAGQTIIFTDTSIAINDTIISWNWNFGDGGIDSIPIVNYTYTLAGTYSVALIVTDSVGCSDTLTKIITINPTPVASFTVLTTCSLDSVFFFSTSTISSGTISSWSWNFGDPASGANNISSLANPSHYYDSLGVYVVSLTVTSDSGCTSAFSDTIIPVKGIIPGFNYSGDCWFAYTFSDSSGVGTGDSITTCFWNFGDGTTDSTCNPIHSYSVAGTYTVTHIVTNAGGCSDTLTNVITILPLPMADFNPTNGIYYTTQAVAFTDLSTNAVSWVWNFGDGVSDNAQNPSHSFNDNGSFDVMLIVTNTDGCLDTVKHSFTVKTFVVSVPSAFTPNGDGQNDVLSVRGGPMKEMDWRIYNEWGNEIFHATSQDNGWDGTYKGKLQPSARYVYILTGITYGEDVVDIHGDVTILK